MVEALYIAATQNQEAAVADYLERELTAQTLNFKQLQQHFRQDAPKSFPQLTVTQHDLSSYDQLIESQLPQHSPERTTCLNDSPESSPALDAPPQAAPIDSHARSLGVYRTPSYAGAMVLCQILTVKKSEAETSVLFELIAHRYERKSLLITANQPFSQWDSIFSDSMMTVAVVEACAPPKRRSIGASRHDL
jgi:hypothetical protein